MGFFNDPDRISESYGLKTAGGLTAYFLAMQVLDTHHHVELRMFNLVILAIGVYFALKKFKNTHTDHVNYFRYGSGQSRLTFSLTALQGLAATPPALVDRLDALLFAYQMGASTRARLLQMLAAMPGATNSQLRSRVRAALIVTAISPDFVIQK